MSEAMRYLAYTALVLLSGVGLLTLLFILAVELVFFYRERAGWLSRKFDKILGRP